jgi:DNA-directed RNA polymerase specialized sigma24 family protein
MPTRAAVDDSDLAVLIAHKDQAAFEAFESLMRKHNGRLFRIARSILRDDAEAEDALQDAYLDAYRNIDGFRGGSQLATWLTRIVINQALGRLRKQKRERVVVPFARRRSGKPSAGALASRTTSSWTSLTTRANRQPTLRFARKCGACSNVESTSFRLRSARSS